MRENDPTETFRNVVCKKETDAAIFVTIDGEDVWIPKSQIHDDSEVYAEDHEGTLVVSSWIAQQRGLI